ncbi:MAG TPA: CusA/CzcA family heavy metal efflux RND transporter [Candidatus Eisenbacteria bacterium]|nr:CusA/CzcA family heavy metal efflux RND transporter [Candidatus Eisenbacteria bacterium]
MLSAVIAWSVRRRIAVLVAAALLSIAGIASIWRLPLDAFPDTTPIQVQVNTSASSLAALEIERQITTPIEQAISGLPGLLEVRSTSRLGLSQVTAVFRDGTDIYLARQTLTERLGTVALPEGIDPPRLGPVTTALGEIFHYLVTGDPKHSAAELRGIQDWIVRPQLQSVPGVAEVNSWGGDERQIQIAVDPAALASRGIRLDDLVEAIERDNRNVGGGVLEEAGRASPIQGVGVIAAPASLEEIVITTDSGAQARLRDVATVVEGRALRHGAVTEGGRGEAVLGLGFLLKGENGREVTHRLRARLQEISRTLPAGVTVEPIYDRTELIDHVLETVRTNLLEGALLVVAVLFAFLGNWRAGLIVAAAIPLSMLVAFDLMLRAGVAGTLMSLGAIDFGLIVDSSVIQVENAVRRLDADGETGGRDRERVVRDAVIEVRRPTMFGEIIILIVYLPILALGGVEGKMFRPMALTVMFALLGSLLLSLTVMPALAATFLKSRPARENRLIAALKRVYRPLLAGAMARPRAVLAAAVVALGVGVALAPRLGSEFVPRLSEGALVLNTVRLAGVSVDESVRYGTRIEQALLGAFPDEIERIWTRTGTAEVATDAMGSEVSDIFVTLRHRAAWKKARTQQELVAAMEKTLESMPGMRVIFTQPIEMRMNEMVAGVRSDLGVKIFGDDLELLRSKASEVERVVREVPGAADVVTEQLTGMPTLAIEVDRRAAARLGVPAGEILDVIEALGSREVGVMQEGARRIPIAVTLEEAYRRDLDMLGSIVLTARDGARIPLADVASIRRVEAPAAINREWGRRRAVVQANVRGRDVGSFAADVRRAVEARVALPPGAFIRYGGQFEHLVRAQRRLFVVVPLALLLVAALLYASLRRPVDVVRVFAAVPLAGVGGVVALWMRGLPFSISAAVGFIALSGVAVLNALVLVSTLRELEAGGMARMEAIRTAAERRLRPVLMTSLVASLGFVPMAFNTGIGAEVQRPLATVVIGGLFSSTLLTLFVLPVFYRIGPGKRGSEAVKP